ncbi:MAG: glycosyltransferase [Planctomycetota bacterium]|jgi:acetyltransferase-like isoleucine patch superfamily enzyme/glycosyltransferase involved in cell wall biosynthesis
MTTLDRETVNQEAPAPDTETALVDVMVIAFNEALNLPYCLKALSGWSNRIFVVDSGSTDGTQEIAKRFGAEVVHHDWPGYAQQKNWGLDNLPFEADWILLVDADEVITPRLSRRLLEIAAQPPEEVRENGFYINRLTFFLGRPIRHCGYFPNWNLRFFKRGRARYEERDVHEHMVIENPVGYLTDPMLHDDRRGLEHYIAKHNRYSTLEARELYAQLTGQAQTSTANITRQSKYRRLLKRYVTPNLPFPGYWRFFYMYFYRLGILDGPAGLLFCRFIASYTGTVALKLKELRQRAAEYGEVALPDLEDEKTPAPGLARPEGSDPVVPAEIRTDPTPAAAPDKPPHTQPEASPYSLKEKLGRTIWVLLGRPLFRVSFHNWHGYRCWILRRFGANVGRGVAIRSNVYIEIPWMLDIADGVSIGDYAILLSLGPVRIGKRSIVSQHAQLCAGTHDYTDPTFKLIRPPIAIGHDVWIGTDAFVGPGVTIGDLSVLGARSSTYKDLPPGQVFVGNPAKRIKERVLK